MSQFVLNSYDESTDSFSFSLNSERIVLDGQTLSIVFDDNQPLESDELTAAVMIFMYAYRDSENDHPSALINVPFAFEHAPFEFKIS